MYIQYIFATKFAIWWHKVMRDVNIWVFLPYFSLKRVLRTYACILCKNRVKLLKTKFLITTLRFSVFYNDRVQTTLTICWGSPCEKENVMNIGHWWIELFTIGPMDPYDIVKSFLHSLWNDLHMTDGEFTWSPLNKFCYSLGEERLFSLIKYQGPFPYKVSLYIYFLIQLKVL